METMLYTTSLVLRKTFQVYLFSTHNLISDPLKISGPPFNNAQFSASFDGGFLGFAKTDDPNNQVVDNIITPNWETFGGIRANQGHTEMLFNRTEDLQPDIRSFTTDSALLARCE